MNLIHSYLLSRRLLLTNKATGGLHCSFLEPLIAISWNLARSLFYCNQLDNIKLKLVYNLKYLGSVLTRDGYCPGEIKMRIAIAKEVFNRKSHSLQAS